MIDVCEVFRNKAPNAERLIAYGFTPLDDGGFTCSRSLRGNTSRGCS